MADQPTAVIDPTRPDLGGNVRHGDAWTYHPGLWRYLVGRFGVRSVLDVGCGEGHAVQFFHRLGVIAHGIDGLLINVRRAVYPIALHDLLTGPYIMPVDLVWSCEVAEHIDANKVDHYLDSLAHAEANQSGGLLKYWWQDPPDETTRKKVRETWHKALERAGGWTREEETLG